MYCIFNPSRFQVVDIEYGSKEEMDSKLIELKGSYPNEDLVVMEVV